MKRTHQGPLFLLKGSAKSNDPVLHSRVRYTPKFTCVVRDQNWAEASGGSAPKELYETAEKFDVDAYVIDCAPGEALASEICESLKEAIRTGQSFAWWRNPRPTQMPPKRRLHRHRQRAPKAAGSRHQRLRPPRIE